MPLGRSKRFLYRRKQGSAPMMKQKFKISRHLLFPPDARVGDMVEDGISRTARIIFSTTSEGLPIRHRTCTNTYVIRVLYRQHERTTTGKSDKDRTLGFACHLDKGRIRPTRVQPPYRHHRHCHGGWRIHHWLAFDDCGHSDLHQAERSSWHLA